MAREPVSTRVRARRERLTACAAGLLGEPVRLEPLPGSSGRSVLHRVLRPPGAPALLAKHFPRRDGARNAGGFGYLRERAGAGLIEAAPAVAAWCDEHRLVLVEDLGPLPDLGSLLRAAPPGPAVPAALRAWARALGAQARPDPARAAELAARLAAADPEARDPGRLPSPGLADRGLERLLAGASPAQSAAVHAELAELPALLRRGPHSCVSTGDHSPANVLLGPAGPRFIDLEGTAHHHPALAAAAVRGGWPLAEQPVLWDRATGEELLAEFLRGGGPGLHALAAEPRWPRLVALGGAHAVLTGLGLCAAPDRARALAGWGARETAAQLPALAARLDRRAREQGTGRGPARGRTIDR